MQAMAADTGNEAWRSSLAEFTKSIVQVAGKAKKPAEDQLLNGIREKVTFTNKDKQAIWILDAGHVEGEIQNELNKSFGGKVRWEGKIAAIEPDPKTQELTIEIEIPIPENLPNGFEFTKSISVKVPKTTMPPKLGDSFPFTGELRKEKPEEVFPPVFAFYGVGTNAGKVMLGIILANAQPAKN